MKKLRKIDKYYFSSVSENGSIPDLHFYHKRVILERAISMEESRCLLMRERLAEWLILTIGRILKRKLINKNCLINLSNNKNYFKI